MSELEQAIEQLIKQAGWLGPFLFILLHLLRPFFLLPVAALCMAGGYLFGFLEGSFYSIVGLSLMSAAFYKLVDLFPFVRQRMMNAKRKIAGERKMTVSQVMILRIMPLVHFHLISLYLMDMTKSYREYMQYSILGVMMPSMVYTAFGQVIEEMAWYMSVLFLAGLFVVYGLLGKLNKKCSWMADKNL